MRTTLNIDDDVLQAAKKLARRDKKTTGEIISELARGALTAPLQVRTTRGAKTLFGFRPFPKRGRVVTNERIEKLREDGAY